MTTGMALNGNELVSFANNQLACGDYQLTGAYNYWHDYHYHYWPIYYPSYHICERSKVEQAFKIVGKLLENKTIEKDLTVKEFMKLVNDIAGII